MKRSDRFWLFVAVLTLVAGITLYLAGYLPRVVFLSLPISAFVFWIGTILYQNASDGQRRSVLRVAVLLAMAGVGAIIGWTNIGFIFVYGIGCIGVGFMIFALALRFYPRRGTAEHFLEGVLRIILYLSVFLLGRGQNEPTEEKIGDLASHVRTRLCGNLFV